MQDNTEWQIDLEPMIKNLFIRKNIIIIIILSLFGLMSGYLSYPFVIKNFQYEVKVEILPTTALQNPTMSKYITSDNMLREFGMVIRSIKDRYVREIDDYGFDKKYSQMIFSSSVTSFEKKIYFESKSSNKEDLETYTEQILQLSEVILKDKLAENINQRYELAKNIVNADKEYKNNFFNDIGIDLLNAEMATEYLQVLANMYTNSVESKAQLTELDTIVKNYDISFTPVYYDTTTINGKRPFVNAQIFALFFFFLGFIISLIVVSMRITLSSEKN